MNNQSIDARLMRPVAKISSDFAFLQMVGGMPALRCDKVAWCVHQRMANVIGVWGRLDASVGWVKVCLTQAGSLSIQGSLPAVIIRLKRMLGESHSNMSSKSGPASVATKTRSA